MSSPTLIPVHLGPNSYSILVGDRLFPHRLAKHPMLRSPYTRVFIVADSRLKSLAQDFGTTLKGRYAGSFFLRGGEATKDISSLPPLYMAAARAHLDRHSVVVAIGGGVIGDVAGFFAATYLRGIRIIHIPTTLVAQVDSAIGGKTGVNLPYGKNLVGAFHQPSLVMVDLSTLKTLPEREFRSGLAEIIKYGIIKDAALFRRLECGIEKILKRDPKELLWVIRRCCAIKARVVIRDEREMTGLRTILNFGHTIGHGIEAAADYSFLHGEAIALGMMGATWLSEKATGLSFAHAQRIRKLIQRAGLPVRLKKPLSAKRILAAIQLDKKVAHRKIHFVLARHIGSAQTRIPVEPKVILQAIVTLN